MELELDYLTLKMRKDQGTKLSEEDIDLMDRLEQNLNPVDLMTVATALGNLDLVNKISGEQLTDKVESKSFLTMSDITKASDRVTAKLEMERTAKLAAHEIQAQTIVKIPLTDMDNYEVMSHVSKTVEEEGLEVSDAYDDDRMSHIEAYISHKFHGDGGAGTTGTEG